MSVRLSTLAVVLAAGSMLAGQSASSRQVEWPFVGGDQENTKYSALADINADTVQRLHIVWQWQHGETRRDDYQTAPGNFETTPLMIDGVLYATAGATRNVAAIDAASGETLWVWRPNEGGVPAWVNRITRSWPWWIRGASPARSL